MVGTLSSWSPLFTSNTPLKGSKRYMCKGGHKVVMITAQLVIEANNEGPGGKLLTVYLDLGAEGTRKQGQIHLIRKRSACVYTGHRQKASFVISG